MPVVVSHQRQQMSPSNGVHTRWHDDDASQFMQIYRSWLRKQNIGTLVLRNIRGKPETI